jgi:hypothetical protein
MNIDLQELARLFSLNPTASQSLKTFLDVLQKESSIEELSKLLSLDYEHVTGHVLSRIMQILPEEDPDLYLSLALWHYQFGDDDNAVQFVQRAKELRPSSLPVLQIEIYISYEQDPATLLRLCDVALQYHPGDPWIFEIKQKLEKDYEVTKMESPPLHSKWEKLIWL